MKLRRLMAVLAFAAAAFGMASAGAAQEAKTSEGKSAADAPVSYYKQVWPLIQRHCQGCHQPARADADFVITSVAECRAGGKSGAALVPGKPDESLLVQYLEGEKEPRMPKGKDPLSPEQIELFRQWIAQGAKDDTPDSARRVLSTDEVPTYKRPPIIRALAYSPDGKHLAVSGYREVVIHASDGSEMLDRYIGLSPRIISITYSRDGELLIVSAGLPGLFGEVQIWDTKAGKLQRSIMTSNDTLFGVSISNDNKLLAVGCADKTARILRVEDGKELHVLRHHSDWVFGTAFSHDGTQLVTISRDRTVKLSLTETGRLVDTVATITPGVRGGGLITLARHPRVDHVLHSGEDGIPRIHKILRTEERLPRVVDIGDGRRTNYMGDDFNLIRMLEQQPGQVISAAFSGDGERLVVGGIGSEVRVYKTADGTRLATLTGHERNIYAVAFKPDGTQVVTGGFDGYVRIYDVESQRLVKRFVPVKVEGEPVAANN